MAKKVATRVPKPLPSVAELRARYFYHDGKLYHQYRDDHDSFNRRWAGKEAGYENPLGYTSVAGYLAHRIIFKMH
jgi:hypothetical protein